MSVLSAYEKMFEDGSAFKPIKIEQPKPNVAEAQGKPSSKPIGEKVQKNGQVEEERHDDYSQFDASMRKFVEAKKQKIKQKSNGTVVENSSNTELVNEIKSLKKRVKQLETALTLVMETQTKLLKS